MATEFVEKADILRAKFFPASKEADLTDIHQAIYPPPLAGWENFELDEVKRAIIRPPQDKAPGPSQIPSRVLRLGLEEIAPTVHHLFETCLQIGYHPKMFKVATTIALRKPGKDYSVPRAYRPIALLETLGKALESVVAKRLSDLAESHSLLPTCQMGARRARNAETALELLTEQVHTVWGCGTNHVASILSLDVEGAFDHVNHKCLEHNLRIKGIPDYLVEWLRVFCGTAVPS